MPTGGLAEGGSNFHLPSPLTLRLEDDLELDRLASDVV